MKVHVLGISGTFMSGIAILAKKKGYEVTGSDTSCYDPIKSILEKENISVIKGHKIKDIKDKDLIIGRTTSANYSFTFKKNLAFGYVDNTISTKELEENALKDKYFIDRKLFPNVDFYSGVIYRAMGIPPNMYTIMFVLGRLPGWIAQWREMRLMKEPIGRPRQLFTGSAPRKFKSKK